MDTDKSITMEKTIASPDDFEYQIDEETNKSVLHIKKSIAEKIEAGAKADLFLQKGF